MTKKPKWWNDYQKGKWIKFYENRNMSLINNKVCWICVEHTSPEFKGDYLITSGVYYLDPPAGFVFAGWQGKPLYFKKYTPPKMPKGLK